MRNGMLAAMGVAVLALAAGSVLAADDPAAPAHPGKGPIAKRLGGMMAEKLGLTPEQKDQVKAILKAAHEEAQQAKDPETRKAIMKAAFDKIRTTVLTEDQRKKLAEAREGVGEKMKERLGILAKKLNLTPEQRDDAKAILKAAREEARNAPDPETKMGIMKAAFEKVKTTVLTEDQRQELAKMKEGLKDRLKERRQHKGAQAGPGAKI